MFVLLVALLSEVARLEGNGVETVTHELRADQSYAVTFEEGVFIGLVINITVPGATPSSAPVNVGLSGLSLQTRPAGAKVYFAWYTEMALEVGHDDSIPPTYILGQADATAGGSIRSLHYLHVFIVVPCADFHDSTSLVLHE